MHGLRRTGVATSAAIAYAGSVTGIPVTVGPGAFMGILQRMSEPRVVHATLAAWWIR
jgi:hypothetical protein